MDQKGQPIRAIIRAGTTADYCQAEALRPGIQAQYLLADRSYDSQAILQTAHQAEMRPVLAPKTDRKYQRNYNQNTTCGIESKMLSSILNAGVESLQVRVKIQTLF